MMKLASTVAAAAIAIGAALTVSAPAQAVNSDQNDTIKYVFCSNTNPVDISYTNSSGGTVERTVNLTGKTKTPGWNCGWNEYNVTAEFGGVHASSIEKEGSGHIYCAIYKNGALVVESEDKFDYVGFTYCI